MPTIAQQSCVVVVPIRGDGQSTSITVDLAVNLFFVVNGYTNLPAVLMNWGNLKKFGFVDAYNVTTGQFNLTVTTVSNTACTIATADGSPLQSGALQINVNILG
jgi:hypothetical protein